MSKLSRVWALMGTVVNKPATALAPASYHAIMDTTKLERLGERRRKLEQELAEVEEQIHAEATAALLAGVRPVDVARLSTYSPAQVRVIARTAGIGPARPGRAA